MIKNNLSIIDQGDKGNISLLVLLKAIDEFKPEAPINFEVYLNGIGPWLIIEEVTPLYRPMMKKIKHLIGIYAEFLQSFDRFPTDQEIADQLNWSLKKFQGYLPKMRGGTQKKRDN